MYNADQGETVRERPVPSWCQRVLCLEEAVLRVQENRPHRGLSGRRFITIAQVRPEQNAVVTKAVVIAVAYRGTKFQHNPMFVTYLRC